MGLFATGNISVIDMNGYIERRLPSYARFAAGKVVCSIGLRGTHQYYDMKCRRISQVFLSICRVDLIRSHRSDPCFKASVKQNGDAVSTSLWQLNQYSSSVVMRMLTAIFGLPCPIGLPKTSSGSLAATCLQLAVNWLAASIRCRVGGTLTTLPMRDYDAITWPGT